MRNDKKKKTAREDDTGNPEELIDFLHERYVLFDLWRQIFFSRLEQR